MPAQQWARLQSDVNVKLRRGAWYRILKLGPLEAVVEVNRRPMAVARTLLQIVQAPPTRWSVVPAPHNALRFPAGWGERYAVCPSCRGRAPLEGRPANLRCSRCNGLFDVAWDEPFPLSA
ncbi:MAG: hypothetical protein ACREMF_00050 [Gemmatimonadales bacterium]